MQRKLFAGYCVAACAFAALASCGTTEDLESRVKRMYGDRAEFSELWDKLGEELLSDQDGSNSKEEGS